MEEFIEFNSVLEKVKPQIEQLSQLIRDATVKVWENSNPTGQEIVAGTLMGLAEGVGKVLWCMDKANGTLDSRAAYETFIAEFPGYCRFLYDRKKEDINMN